MDKLYAKYEDGKIWWRGTSDRFTYRQPSEALMLAERFERESSLKLPEWRTLRAAFSLELRQAISQWEQDNAE